MENPWKKLSGKQIYDNPWIRVEEDQVINPSGGQSIYGKVLYKNLAVAVIPVDDQGYTYLVGQYRYVHDEYSWEIPMGGSDKGESTLETAKRELREETGLVAKNYSVLVPEVHLSNCIGNEKGFVFLAKDLEQKSPLPDDTEKLEVKRVPIKEAIERVLSGEIKDSLSVMGLQRLALLTEFNQLFKS